MISVAEPKVAREAEKRFDWPLCYDAENYILDKIDSFLARNRFAASLSDRMLRETGTLFLDWIDHIVLGAQASVDVGPGPKAAKRDSLSPGERAGVRGNGTSEVSDVLRNLGYRKESSAEASSGKTVLWHPEAMLPRVILDRKAQATDYPITIALRVDSIADFMLAHRHTSEPEGTPLSRFRRLTVAEENGASLDVIERRGYRGYLLEKKFDPAPFLKAQELWKTRPRLFASDEEGFTRTQTVLDRVIDLVGQDLACKIVFEQERAYWQGRNRAAQIQKARQDKLGLGWANHDHHTFRSSREHFVDLMRVLEKLGFERRERYYAGAQAGWGAQILEQSVEGIVAFCDVDLQPEETEIDFSRKKLPPSSKLGTIGLWVGLHGESVLEAGLHHLECRFDYSLLRDQLADLNVNVMKPFSDFPFLKQAFTEGERWPVRRERVERLRDAGLIDSKQFDQFIREGAIGSHLENLQRKGGFKGFNQKSVSVIIQATDPRLQHANA